MIHAGVRKKNRALASAVFFQYSCWRGFRYWAEAGAAGAAAGALLTFFVTKS